MGIGMVLMTKDYYADSIIRMLKEVGEEARVIGEVVKGNRRVELV